MLFGTELGHEVHWHFPWSLSSGVFSPRTQLLYHEEAQIHRLWRASSWSSTSRKHE